jgi:hypothetical protein
MEEQLREVEVKSLEKLTTEQKKHRELLVWLCALISSTNLFFTLA